MDKFAAPYAVFVAFCLGLFRGVTVFQINDSVTRANHFGVYIEVIYVAGAKVTIIFVFLMNGADDFAICDKFL